MLTTEDIASLPAHRRRGSYPRCLTLTSGPRPEVAARLTALTDGLAVVNDSRHVWLPVGKADRREAQLGKTPALLTAAQRDSLLGWWLVYRRGTPPTWDIASQATIEGREGLLLVEAKAHTSELHAGGKARDGNIENHQRIGMAMAEANAGLKAIQPGWAISRDDHYQLANRFAWAWKIATLGVPVVLVYLGFLGANEMRDQGEPFADALGWKQCVLAHAQGVVPVSAWGARLEVTGTPLWPLIRALQVALQNI